MNTLKYALTVLFFVLITPVIRGALPLSLSLVYSSPLSFDLSTITNAGDHTQTVVNSSRWLNYSAQGTSSYSITVAITSGSVPAGIEIHLRADATGSIDKGNIGIPTGNILLSNYSTTLINGISTCVTGNGIGYGANLIMTAGITNFALIHPIISSITITYTLAQI